LALNYKTPKSNYIFFSVNKHSLIMCTEIHVDISPSFHTLTNILSKAALHVKMQKNHKVFTQLSAALTSVQLKMC